MNKKLINLKGIKQILNDPELKNIMGGSSPFGGDCRLEPNCDVFRPCVLSGSGEDIIWGQCRWDQYWDTWTSQYIWSCGCGN